MRVQLIVPYVPRDSLGTVTPWDIPSLGIGYIAAVLEKAGHIVNVIEAYIEKLPINKVFERIQVFNPQLIGITSNVYTAKFGFYTAYEIKRKFQSIPLVVGGPYPSAVPDLILEKGIVDFVVIGEGERTILDLVREIEHGSGNFEAVDGVAFLKDGKIIRTKPRERCEDLDQIPFPAWHLFPNLNKYKNLRGALKRPYLPILTSRGCPYGCIWCDKSVYGRRVRRRSVESTLEEIQTMIAKYGIKEFAVMDDSFTENYARVKELCLKILKNKLNISLNLYPGIRADTVSNSLLKLLKLAGVHRVTIGVESGNQEILYKIKKNLKLESVRKAVQLIKKAGLFCDCFFILGLPFETPKTIMDTINFALELDPDHAYFFIATPYPGTEMYDLIQKNGEFLIEYKMGVPTSIVDGKATFKFQKLDPRVVERLFKYAYKHFYFRISKIINLFVVYFKFLLKYRSLNEIRWLISQSLMLFKI